MRIGLILYGCTEDIYSALYTLSELELDQGIHEKLKDAKRHRKRCKEALKKAKALGPSCIPGGKSRKGAING